MSHYVNDCTGVKQWSFSPKSIKRRMYVEAPRQINHDTWILPKVNACPSTLRPRVRNVGRFNPWIAQAFNIITYWDSGSFFEISDILGSLLQSLVRVYHNAFFQKNQKNDRLNQSNNDLIYLIDSLSLLAGGSDSLLVPLKRHARREIWNDVSSCLQLY